MRLRHTRVGERGYYRHRHGRGFRYVDSGGRPVTDPAERARIKALVIPPAWEDVWICAAANGHLQASGRDAAGRRQYLYHPHYRERQDLAKHEHVLEVAETLPRIREAVEAQLSGKGLVHDRVLAAAVRLLDLGFFRVGGDRYADLNQTYGLTTLLREHIVCGRGGITFTYRAKHGKEQVQAVVDPAACRVVGELMRRRGGGDRLLAYWEHRAWHDVTADEVNTYLKSLSGLEITAKDFRTWHATVLASVALAVSDHARITVTGRRKAIARAVREVSQYLGNTPAVCRASYINPRVIELFEQGVSIVDVLPQLGEEQTFGVPATHGAAEEAVLHLLRTGRAPARSTDT
jgi:DNA topoisomerase-1